MPSRWRYVIEGYDPDTGRKLTMVDETYTYAMDLPSKPDVGTAIVLLNEIIARTEDAINTSGNKDAVTDLPLLGECTVCHEIVTNNMLVGVSGPRSEGGGDEPNTCALCEARRLGWPRMHPTKHD